MEDKEYIQGSDEWLKMRSNYIMASDAPVIMGASPYNKTPLMLWEEKLGLSKKQKMNAAMKWGKDKEDEARSLYTMYSGIEVKPCVKFHKKISYLGASLDGLSDDGANMVEIKCTNRINHEAAGAGVIPYGFIAQLQHQMEVVKLDEMDYFSWHQGDGIIVKIKKDNKYIENMLKKHAQFWDCVCSMTEPPITDKDFVHRNNDWCNDARDLFEVKSQKIELLKREKELELLLRDKSEGRNSCAGGYKYARSVSLGRLNYKSIVDHLNADLDDFEKFRGSAIETWRLSKG